jgi:hypothetical protein
MKNTNVPLKQHFSDNSLFFWQHWGLNSGPHACETALQSSQNFLFCMFVKVHANGKRYANENKRLTKS